MSGARVDQQNVTLDGVDVNDPELQTAYTSAVRITSEALQEFRVSTSNYGAEYRTLERPSGVDGDQERRQPVPRIGLLVRAPHGDVDQRVLPGAGAARDRAGVRPAPKLDKDIFGGSIGGPIKKDRVFFYFNYERLAESSEQPVNARRALGFL